MKQLFSGLCGLACLSMLVLNYGTAGEKGKTVVLDGLKSPLPEGWKMEKPSNNMRTYQFVIPKVDGDKKDAELVVFFFGAGGGGGVDANIKRWKDQFVAPGDKDIDDVAKVTKFKVKDVPVTMLDVKGTYLFKPAPFVPKATPMPGYRMFGVVFASENGPYFIRMVGPEKTVTANAKKLDTWLKSFK